MQPVEYVISSHPSTHTPQRSPPPGELGPAQRGHTLAGTCVRPARCTVGCQVGVGKQTASSCCSLCLEHAFILILPGLLSSHHSGTSCTVHLLGPASLDRPERPLPAVTATDARSVSPKPLTTCGWSVHVCLAHRPPCCPVSGPSPSSQPPLSSPERGLPRSPRTHSVGHAGLLSVLVPRVRK